MDESSTHQTLLLIIRYFNALSLFLLSKLDLRDRLFFIYRYRHHRHHCVDSARFPYGLCNFRAVYINCVVTLCHYRIYSFVHESRAPVTWSSKPHMYALRTCFSCCCSYFDDLFKTLTNGFVEDITNCRGI